MSVPHATDTPMGTRDENTLRRSAVPWGGFALSRRRSIFEGEKMLNEKDVAPDFEVLDDTGMPTKLSDFRGKRVVLYFFPKAMTSG